MPPQALPPFVTERQVAAQRRMGSGGMRNIIEQVRSIDNITAKGKSWNHVYNALNCRIKYAGEYKTHVILIGQRFVDLPALTDSTKHGQLPSYCVYCRIPLMGWH